MQLRRSSRSSWRARYSDCDGTAKGVVQVAFHQLRKRGYLARMNFSCCGSCAGFELSQKASELKDKGTEVAGCAFYHHQDESRYQDSGRLYVSFGSLGTEKHGDLGKETSEAGREIVELLNAAAAGTGVSIRWDGQASSRIEVWDVARVKKEQADLEEKAAVELRRQQVMYLIETEEVY